MITSVPFVVRRSASPLVLTRVLQERLVSFVQAQNRIERRSA